MGILVQIEHQKMRFDLWHCTRTDKDPQLFL